VRESCVASRRVESRAHSFVSIFVYSFVRSFIFPVCSRAVDCRWWPPDRRPWGLMLLWSPLSLLGNYRFSRTPRPNEDAIRREEEEQKEEEKEEEDEEENGSTTRFFSETDRVGAKGFTSSGFHPRFFHRVTSAREIRFAASSRENPRFQGRWHRAKETASPWEYAKYTLSRWVGRRINMCRLCELHISNICISE